MYARAIVKERESVYVCAGAERKCVAMQGEPDIVQVHEYGCSAWYIVLSERVGLHVGVSREKRMARVCVMGEDRKRCLRL